jgi:glycosyltransferase involved in cell wall biosynthesis
VPVTRLAEECAPSGQIGIVEGMPRFAIIVPCFNDGETLGETVASIRNGAQAAELLIVDDGSTDDRTLQVLSQLEEEGVRVIHQANRGPGAAAMAGVEATSAPYVMRFDADDLLEPGAADALADALDGAPDVAAAWGDMQTFGLTSFRVPSPPTLDPWLITYTNCLPGPGALLRRDALLEAGGWQLRDGFEDWDLWLALAERGQTGVCLRRVIFHYRRDRRGRFVEALAHAAKYYDDLRARHKALFATRPENRRSSSAPTLLKLSVTTVESIPGLARLTRIQLCELCARLAFGGAAMVAPMVRQAIELRKG